METNQAQGQPADGPLAAHAGRFTTPEAREAIEKLHGDDLAMLPAPMIGDYLDFISRMLIAFGAVFELPVLVFFLAVAGVIDHTHLIKFARYFVVLSFFISAIITPPDIMSQFLLAIPLCLLYVVSIGIAWLIGRKKPQPAS